MPGKIPKLKIPKLLNFESETNDIDFSYENVHHLLNFPKAENSTNSGRSHMERNSWIEFFENFVIPRRVVLFS